MRRNAQTYAATASITAFAVAAAIRKSAQHNDRAGRAGVRSVGQRRVSGALPHVIPTKKTSSSEVKDPGRAIGQEHRDSHGERSRAERRIEALADRS
jgi:hypothetical protein